MIDTHSHIYGPEFASDIDDVVTRAREAGVKRILLPNINLDTISPMLSLCDSYPGYMYPMLGLHPTDVGSGFNRQLDAMWRILADDRARYIAVGEVGLDFYWDTTFKEEQIEAFCRQIEWAADYGLPLMIHSRSAHNELVDIIGRYYSRGISGVFHCFGGTRDEAEQLLSFDRFVLGIGGVVTYKKSTLPDVLSGIPLSRIVLETDSPYLAPMPHRGTRNESSYVADVMRCLANIYNVSAEDVSRVTNENVYRVFPRLK